MNTAPFHNNGFSVRSLLGLALASLMLSACGGSDKKSEPVPKPGAPTLSVSASGAKTLGFSWSPVSYATSYKLLKSESGTGGYVQIAEHASGTSATDVIAVHLHDWINTRYILEACNVSGCTASAPVATADALLGIIGALRADTPAANDYLGYSLAISDDGQYLAAGVTNRDLALPQALSQDCEQSAPCSDIVDNAGSVIVFHRQNGSWTQQAELRGLTGVVNQNNYLGYSLALSGNGDTLVVGTPFESSGAQGINGERNDARQLESGAVYVFSRVGTQWYEQAYLKASNAEAYDYFGLSLALSVDGNFLAVGAPGEASKATGVNGDQTDNSVGIAGAVYFFERQNSTWTQTVYLKAAQQVYITAPCFIPSPVRCLPTQAGRFGSSLSLSKDGSTLAVGAVYDNSNATGVNGAPNNLNAVRSGAAYVFVKEGNAWNQEAYIKASNTQPQANFGYRVALNGNGNTLAVSSIEESSQSTGINGDASDVSAGKAGAVYVFSRTAGQWSQEAYVKASNTGVNQEFGSSLALSTDGSWLAVGAAREKSQATGLDGNQLNELADRSGAVYLFQRATSGWAQHRYIKAPVSQAGLSFGFSLGMTGDGRTLAVGAIGAAAPRQAESPLANAGAVYLY